MMISSHSVLQTVLGQAQPPKSTLSINTTQAQPIAWHGAPESEPTGAAEHCCKVVAPREVPRPSAVPGRI
jgi:hypothetical protein